MSTATVESSPPTASPAAGLAARTGGVAVVASIVGNLVVLLGGRLADADMSVVRTGTTEAVDVGASMVLLMTVIPLILGTAALAVATRWGSRGWTALAWVGLAIGVLTVAMPLSVEGSTSTRTTLALMHLVTGAVWFLAVRWALTRRSAR